MLIHANPCSFMLIHVNSCWFMWFHVASCHECDKSIANSIVSWSVNPIANSPPQSSLSAFRLVLLVYIYIYIYVSINILGPRPFQAYQFSPPLSERASWLLAGYSKMIVFVEKSYLWMNKSYFRSKQLNFLEQVIFSNEDIIFRSKKLTFLENHISEGNK